MRIRGAGLVIALLVIPAGRGADEPKAKEREESARALLNALVKGDYDAAGKDFDDNLKKLAPAAKLKEIWETVQKQLGAFKREKAGRVEGAAAYLTVEFEKATLDFKVAFNKAGQIEGFAFVPPKSKFKYEPPPYAKLETFTERAVTVGEGEWAVPGTLSLPKGEGPFPGVVLVAGSGPNDRDGTVGANKPLRDLALGLASRGVAVLCYDKRTHTHNAKTVKVLKTFTIKEEVLDDALAAVALLRKQKGVDPKRVFVIGHSLGALLAPKLGELDPELAGLVLLAGTARPLGEVLSDQFTYLFSLKGELTDKEKEELEKLKKTAARLDDPKLSPETPSKELPFGGTAVYWLSLQAVDGPATALKIKQPLLILQGERDYQVTMKDFAAWRKKLAERKGVTFKSYPRLNHLFVPGEGKSRPQEYDKPGHVPEEVVKDIAEWIKR